jgi:hypothetical protein
MDLDAREAPQTSVREAQPRKTPVKGRFIKTDRGSIGDYFCLHFISFRVAALTRIHARPGDAHWGEYETFRTK